MADLVIRAAGVIVLRPGSRGPKVLLVHRPRHKDWSLPKGKLDKGEHVLAAAVRECDEETGIVPVLGPYVGRQRYPVMGRPKTVDYWVATAGTDNGFTADDEVDEIRWVTIDQSKRLLSYDRDVQMVRTAVALPRTTPLIILRHAAATKRSDFTGKDDSDRPLTGKGRSQARQLTPILSAYGVDRLHSSDANRCMQTVKRYAAAAQVTIEQEPLLSEPGYERNPKSAVRRVVALADQDRRVCVCSHRPVLPAVLAPFASSAKKTADKASVRAFSGPLPPAGMVIVHRKITKSDWTVVAAERHHL